MRNLKILLAEDDEQSQAMLRLILTRRGHVVKSVWNGVQALDAVKQDDYDLVLMDLNMPEMDGLEATRQIRLWENGARRLPIVILTAAVPMTIGEKFKAAGADSYISKPFDVKRLELLVNVIANDAQNTTVEQSMYVLEGAVNHLAVLDRQSSLTRFDGDEELYRDSLAEFLKGLPARFENLQKAREAGDLPHLSLLAHNLKGVSANFGANLLSVLAFRLDEYATQGNTAQVDALLAQITEHLPVLRQAVEVSQ